MRKHQDMNLFALLHYFSVGLLDVEGTGYDRSMIENLAYKVGSAYQPPSMVANFAFWHCRDKKDHLLFLSDLPLPA